MDHTTRHFLEQALQNLETLDLLADAEGDFPIFYANPTAQSTFERFAGMFKPALGGIEPPSSTSPGCDFGLKSCHDKALGSFSR